MTSNLNERIKAHNLGSKGCDRARISTDSLWQLIYWETSIKIKIDSKPISQNLQTIFAFKLYASEARKVKHFWMRLDNSLKRISEIQDNLINVWR